MRIKLGYEKDKLEARSLPSPGWQKVRFESVTVNGRFIGGKLVSGDPGPSGDDFLLLSLRNLKNQGILDTVSLGESSSWRLGLILKAAGVNVSKDGSFDTNELVGKEVMVNIEHQPGGQRADGTPIPPRARPAPRGYMSLEEFGNSSETPEDREQVDTEF